MNTGKMNKRIKFIIKGKGGTDNDGYPLFEERIIRSVWASVKGLRGREFFRAAQTQSENTKVFNCRYFKELEENMYIKYNNKTYDIKSINDINERHIEYEIHAKEVKSSG